MESNDLDVIVVSGDESTGTGSNSFGKDGNPENGKQVTESAKLGSDSDTDEDDEVSNDHLKKIFGKIRNSTELACAKGRIEPRCISPLVLRNGNGDEYDTAELFLNDLLSLQPYFLLKYCKIGQVNIHPIDLLNTIFDCIPMKMRVYASMKLHDIRLAIPILLKDSLNPGQFKLHLENLSSIKMGETSLLCYEELPVISFARLGELKLKSKSKLINHWLMNGNRDLFYHKDMVNGDANSIFIEGTVNVSWLHLDETPVPKFVVLNLHGDARECKSQLKWLSRISNMLIIFAQTAEEVVDIQECIEETSDCVSKICIMEKSSDKSLLKNMPSNMMIEKFYTKKRGKYQENNESECVEAIDSFASELHEGKKIPVMQFGNFCSNDMVVSTIGETSINFKSDAYKEMMKSLDELTQNEELDDLWSEWIRTEKNWFRMRPDPNKSFENIKLEIQEKQCGIEKRIKGLVEPQKRILDDFADRLMIGDIRNNLINFNRECLRMPSLSMDKLCRKIAQCFELSDNEEMDKISQFIAKSLVEGFSMELMEGRNSWIYIKWMKKVFHILKSMLPGAKIVVLSVLGVQSSYKSTLLNSLFGLSFRTTLGRCTDGVHLQLLRIDDRAQPELGYSHVLVLDVEGLESVEKREDLKEARISSTSHDNELATAVLSMSDLCIINIKGDNTAEIENVLKICILAICRMRDVKLSCSTVFVHQNVDDQSAMETTTKMREILKKEFNQAYEISLSETNAADQPDFQTLFDLDGNVFYLPYFKYGSPNKGFYTEAYANAISHLKKSIITRLKNKGLHAIDLISKINIVWNAILDDDFVYSFVNLLEMHVYKDIEKLFNQSIEEINEILMSLSTEMQSKIEQDIENMRPIPPIKHTVSARTLIKSNEIVDRFNESFESGDHQDVRSKYQSVLVNKLRLEIQSKVDKLVERLDLFQMSAKHKRELTTDTADIEKKFLSTLESKAKEWGKLSDSEKKIKFQEIWKENMDPYLKEASKISSGSQVDILAMVQHALHEQFKDMEDITRILKKYAGIESIPKEFRFESGRHTGGRNLFSKFKVTVKMFATNLTGIELKKLQKDSVDELVGLSKHKLENIIKSDKLKVSLGISETYISSLVVKLKNFVVFKIKSLVEAKLNKYFVRDLVFHLLYTSIPTLEQLQRKYLEEIDTKRILESKKPGFEKLFMDFCTNREITKIIAGQFQQVLYETLKKTVTTKSKLILRNVVRNVSEFSSDMSKEDFIYHILVKIAEDEKSIDTFPSIMGVATDTSKAIRSYIDKKINSCAHTCDVEEKVKKEKDDLIECNLEIIEQLCMCENENPILFKTWLQNYACKTSELFTFPKNEMFCFDDKEIANPQKLLTEIKHLMAENQIEMKDDKTWIAEIVDEFVENKSGCPEQCPICGMTCQIGVRGHPGPHKACHTDVSLKFKYTKDLKSETKEALMGSCHEIMHTNLKIVLKDQCPSLNDWIFDDDSKQKAFWKWFMHRFKAELEEKSKLTMEIPEEWKNITPNAAVKSLTEKPSKSQPVFGSNKTTNERKG